MKVVADNGGKGARSSILEYHCSNILEGNYIFFVKHGFTGARLIVKDMGMARDVRKLINGECLILKK